MIIPPLRKFADLVESDLKALYERRRPSRVLLANDVASVELSSAAPAADLPGYFEVPPSPIIMDGKVVHAIYQLTNNDTQGQWIRTLVLVYRLGGRVVYRKHDAEYIEAYIDFREPREGDRVLLAFGPRPIVRVDDHVVEVCQAEYCVPVGIGHLHTTINRGWLFWDGDSNLWRLPGKKG